MFIAKDYIRRINNCISNPEAENAGDLVKEIVAAFSTIEPGIKTELDRYNNRALPLDAEPRYDDVGDLKMLKGKLLVIEESDQRQANSHPELYPLEAVDEHLAECDKLIESGEERASQQFIDMIVRVYENDIRNIFVDISRYEETSKTDSEHDLMLIREQLRHYRAHLAMELVKSPSTSYNIQASSSSTSNVENTVTMSQAVKTVATIPDDVLNKDSKDRLKALLADLESNRGEGKDGAEKHLGNVLAWLSDKGVDVAIAVLPYVVNILQTLA